MKMKKKIVNFKMKSNDKTFPREKKCQQFKKERKG